MRRLIRTPTHQLRPMAKPVTGDMIEPHLNDEFGPQRLPFATIFRCSSGLARLALFR